MSGFIRAFAYFSGASVISTLTQIAKGKLTAVLLGVGSVGILNQLTTLSSLFSILAGMGFYNGVVRHLAISWAEEDREALSAQMSSYAIFTLTSSLLFTAGGCIFSEKLSQLVFNDNGEHSSLVCLALLAVPFFTLGQIYRAMLNATRSVAPMIKARVAADILSVVALLILVLLDDLRGAVFAYILLQILFLAISLFYSNRALGSRCIVPKLRKFRWMEVTKNAVYGINGLVSVAAGSITAIVISIWIISDFGAEANGIYTVAMRVSTIYLGGVTAAAGGYYFPTLSAAKNNSEFTQTIDLTLKLYMYIIPPIIAVLMMCGDVLMQILFSKEFIPAASLLIIMLQGDIFRIVAETVGLSLVAKKHVVTSTAFYIGWASLFMAISAWLLPSYGIQGVAIAYLVSHFMNALAMSFGVYAVLGYLMSLDNVFALIRSTGLLTSVALVMWCADNRSLLVYVAVVALILAWFGISLFDLEFRRLVCRVIRAGRQETRPT